MSTVELIDHEENDQDEVTGALAVATTRQAQEVQAAMIIARRFPRDEMRSLARMKQAAKRKRLAEQSQYEYKRGGQLITGPSIRLAEVMAQNWGNLDYGIMELERKRGESLAMSYCWDLETNVRQTKIFTVRHIRDRSEGATQLTSERDIYEHVANYGARRLRACILGIIPGDIQQEMMDECDKTINGVSDKPLIDRIRDMVSMFMEVSVTPDMLEAKLGHKLDACTQRQLLSLGRIYTSIRDGISDRDEHFPPTKTNGKPKADQAFEELTNSLATSVEKSRATLEEKSKGTNGNGTPPTPSAASTATVSAQTAHDPTESAFGSFVYDLTHSPFDQADAILERYFGEQSTIEFSEQQFADAKGLVASRKAEGEKFALSNAPPVPSVVETYLARIGRAGTRGGLKEIRRVAGADADLKTEDAKLVIETIEAKYQKLFGEPMAQPA